MLIDTHCHVNMIVKKQFDTQLKDEDYDAAQIILNAALQNNVTKIINVGTSLIESINCMELAKKFIPMYASVGIHPNDLSDSWKNDLAQIGSYLSNKEGNKIIAIGEIGIDLHYPDYNLTRQKDAFRAQIELALKYNLPIIVHTRDGGHETLSVLSEYKKDNIEGVIHCFSETLDFAQEGIKLGFLLGIGGTITYPKNNELRLIISAVGLENIILETDAPFLAPQIIRGKINTPAQIANIAQYIADLLNVEFDVVAKKTTDNAQKLFRI